MHALSSGVAEELALVAVVEAYKVVLVGGPLAERKPRLGEGEGEGEGGGRRATG